MKRSQQEVAKLRSPTFSNYGFNFENNILKLINANIYYESFLNTVEIPSFLLFRDLTVQCRPALNTSKRIKTLKNSIYLN